MILQGNLLVGSFRRVLGPFMGSLVGGPYPGALTGVHYVPFPTSWFPMFIPGLVS